MVKGSVVMTVWNRDHDLLLAVFRQLRRSLPDDWEVVVVDDGSTADYSGVKQLTEQVGPKCRWIETGEYEAFRICGGFNNPARAFNVGVEAAEGETLLILSSDVLVKPKLFQRLAMAGGEGLYTPGVIDIDTGMQYCGPLRVFPMPWCLGTTKKAVTEAGGWDEAYLQGLCYEDNDFVGRLALIQGRVLADWDTVVYHMSHEQPAYNLKDPDVMAANERNRRLTIAKWRGVPFDQAQSPFDVLRGPHPSGLIAYECKAQPGVLEGAMPKGVTVS